MEDEHSITKELIELDAIIRTPSSSTRHGSAFFGVYDGHGGAQAAEYCRDHLPSMLVDSIVARSSEETSEKGETCGRQEEEESSAESAAERQDRVVGEGIIRAFQTIDVQFLKHCWDSGIGNVGTTVTTILVHNGVLYCGNAGDARTVLCRKGKAMNLSQDHKPTDSNEEKRVRDVGGFVVMGRVMGKLAVSRAIGDSEFKRKEGRMMTEFSITGPLVIPDPDVSSTGEFFCFRT
jgi:serine/threonine protein phosphatase PrpC